MRRFAPLAALGALCACAASPAPTSAAFVFVPTAEPAPRTIARPEAPAIGPPAPPLAPAAPVSLSHAVRDDILADSANDGGLDAEILRQGRELELSRDLAGARKAYYELIVKAPQSSRVPYAYLAFADLFFDEAEHDDPSKLPLAYQKVLAYPPPANLAYAFAWHRLGVIASRMGDHARALDAQRKTLAAVKQYPGLAGAAPLAEAARRELAAVAGHLGSTPASHPTSQR
jgi:tetratricopeptide (TPR) repeat protein